MAMAMASSAPKIRLCFILYLLFVYELRDFASRGRVGLFQREKRSEAGGHECRTSILSNRTLTHDRHQGEGHFLDFFPQTDSTAKGLRASVQNYTVLKIFWPVARREVRKSKALTTKVHLRYTKEIWLVGGITRGTNQACKPWDWESDSRLR